MGKQRLTDLVVQEISLVDRPANPEARVSIWKRDPEAFVNPIKSAVEALRKAFRAESHREVDEALETFEAALHTDVDKSDGDDFNLEDTMDPTALAAMINKAVGDALAPVVADVSVLKMDPDMRGFMEKLSDEDKKSFMGMSMDERKKYMASKMKKSDDGPTDFTKALDDAVQKALAPIQAENLRLAKALTDQQTAQRVGKLAEELREAGVAKADELAAHLDGLPEAAHKALKETLVATAKAAEAAGLFAEVGNTGEGAATDPYAQLMAKADELRKSEPGLTKEQAFDEAYSNPANAQLVRLYKAAR